MIDEKAKLLPTGKLRRQPMGIQELALGVFEGMNGSRRSIA
jgi:hypothetical protein